MFAHFALKLAREQGLDVSVSICDGKNFSRQGPVGCNMCAGVISASLARRLSAQGFDLPEGRVQRWIRGYYLRTVVGGFPLDHPDGRQGIRTVFRGNGPRLAQQAANVSFDDFLLDHVKRQGVNMIQSPVLDIRLPDCAADRASVLYGDKARTVEIDADLIVGAFGLNTSLLDKVQALGFGYAPPRRQRVAQVELHVGHDWIERGLENRIAVLTVDVGDVNLAILTPKAEHLTLTLLGSRDLDGADVHAFLNHPPVRDFLPPDWEMPVAYCHCFPRLAVTAAKSPFTDRLVLIGDASFSRYYKNGIESAFVTAQLAAETAFRLGVSRQAFAKGYLKPAKSLIVRDNLYGRLLFALPNYVGKSALLAETEVRVIAAAKPGYSGRALRACLWNVLSGDVPYRQIFWQMCNPRLLGRLALTALIIYLGRLVGGRSVLRLAA